jgi:hypothetical protein
MKSKNDHEVLKCSICKGDVDHHMTKDGEVYWTKGHNADPVIIKDSNERACDWCDEHVVIPVRLKMMGYDKPEMYSALKDTLPTKEISIDKLVERRPL